MKTSNIYKNNLKRYLCINVNMDIPFLIILRNQSRHIKSLQQQINVLKKEVRYLRENREWSATELANYDWQPARRDFAVKSNIF